MPGGGATPPSFKMTLVVPLPRVAELVEIKNPIGKSLDTDFHEAITSIPAKSKKDSGKIIDVIEKGYKMGNKVIRFTKVVIGK